MQLIALYFDEKCVGIDLGTGSLEVSNKIVSVLLLLQSSEDHFGARDVLLRVL